MNILKRMGILKDPPGLKPSKLENYGIGLVSEGIHSTINPHDLKTPFSTFHVGSGYKGIEFDNVIKAVRMGTYLDLETRGLDPRKDPPWLGAIVSPGVSELSEEAYLETIGTPLFRQKLDAEGRVDYDYLSEKLFNIKPSRPILQPGLSEEDAIKQVIDSMGQRIKPMVYEGRPVDLLKSETLRQFLKTAPEAIRNGTPAQQIAAYFDPQLNPSNRALNEFMHGGEGIFTQASKDVLAMTGQKMSAGDIDRIRKNLMNELHTGKGLNWDDWLKQSFDAADQSGKTIIVHNLQFESRMAAGRTSQTFYNELKERYLHSYSQAKSKSDDIFTQRIYTTSTALHNAKFEAMRNWSNDAWGNVFDEWARHADLKTNKVKVLDSMDLGRSVFGMAQEQLGRKGLYKWRNTQSMAGLSLSHYADALTRYHESIGDPLPDFLRKELHRSRADALLTESYVEDMLQIGRLLREGRGGELNLERNNRYRMILERLGEINADPMTRLNAARKQALQEFGTIIGGDEVEIRDWDPDRPRGPYHEVTTMEWVPDDTREGGSFKRMNRKVSDYKRRKTNRMEEVVDYHIKGFNKNLRKDLTDKQIQRFRESLLSAGRQMKQAYHTRKPGAVQKVAEQLEQVDAFNMDKAFSPDQAKRFIGDIERKTFAKATSHQLGMTGKIGWLTAGMMGGAVLMKSMMGSEAEHYMNQMYSKYTKYEQDQGVFEQVDVLASMGAGAFGGAVLASSFGPGMEMTLSKSAHEMMKLKNVGRNLPYMAAAGLALTSTLYSLKSNVSDVVDAEPTEGHPFQMGSAFLGAAAMTGMAYGQRYGFAQDAFAKRLEGEPRAIDKLANLTGLRHGSDMLSGVSDLVLHGGRTASPKMDWARSSIIDPVTTKIKSVTSSKGFQSVMDTMGRYKIPGVIAAGVGMMFGADYLFGQEDNVIPAQHIDNMEIEGMGEYGYSGPMRKANTPFGSRNNPAKIIKDAWGQFNVSAARAKPQNYYAPHIIEELYNVSKHKDLIKMDIAAHMSVKQAEVGADFVDGSYKKWMDNTSKTNPLALEMTYLHDVGLSVPQKKVDYGINSYMPVGDMGHRFGPFTAEVPEFEMQLPRGKKMIDPDLFETKGPNGNITRVTEAHLANASNANKNAQVTAKYKDAGRRAVNMENARPGDHLGAQNMMHTVPRRNPPINSKRGLERQVLSVIMDKDHAIKSNIQGYGVRHSRRRPRMRANRSNGHLTGV